MVNVEEDKFSGFIFKIHANLDPKHRDRIAFLRVCSGKFERNKYFHHVRLDKDVRFSNPYSFLARVKMLLKKLIPVMWWDYLIPVISKSVIHLLKAKIFILPVFLHFHRNI